MHVTIPCMWQRLVPLLALAAPIATPAAAESPIAEVICAPRAELLARMRGAEIAGAGLRDTEAVVEVWTEASGDWTLVQSYANGTACILAMGEAWEAPAPPPA
jgi:predicted methyltransferase